MAGRAYDRLRRFASAALPWLVGGFMVLAIGEEVEGSLAPLGTLVGAVQGAALHWRRTRPVLVLGVALAGALATQALAPGVILPIAGYFAIFALAAERPPRVSLPGLAALVAVTCGNFLVATVDDSVFALALTAGVWALGEAARSRRGAIEQAARRAATDEQARIAREMHDVIAHSVSAIVVQAAAADDVFDEHPDQARAALRSIDTAGRDALAELRRLLSAVRPGAAGNGGDGGDAGHPPGPAPGLDRLDELAEPLRAAGLRVVVHQEGAPGPLPAGVELSAYRIVQEALTNTLRHARATSAEVRVVRTADAVEVDVRDDGRDGHPPERPPGGHGIAGMRERAALLGGTLDAGPLPRGAGYRVRARLPLGPAR